MKLRKKLPDDEIDLSKVILTVWKNKSKIFLIVFLTVIISIFLKIRSKVPEASFLAKTEILPISIFDESKYLSFNSNLFELVKKNVNSIKSNGNSNEITPTLIPDNTSFTYIDQTYLYNLFVEKLNQRNLFKKAIKKLNIVKKENYTNNKSYENAIIEKSSSIKISYNKTYNSEYNIEFITNSKKDWEEFLRFIENSANTEIHAYIKNNFDLFIADRERYKGYLIEDINIEISNNLENKLITDKLKKEKRRIEQDRTTERLMNLFEDTPVNRSNKFTAAKFDIQLTSYIDQNKKNHNYSMKQTIILSILLGLILGITFVLIESTIKKLNKLSI